MPSRITFDNSSGIPEWAVGTLFNGIDYLWWHASQQDVTSAQINIPIVYLHAGTQVVFEVTAGDSLKPTG